VRRFNAPPGWPPPPNVRWRPPKGWVPHETWPPAPPDWKFWVNENGRRVMGPIGRYGAPGLMWLYGGAGVMLALVLLVSCGPFGPDSGRPVSSQSSTSGDGSSEDPQGTDSSQPSDGTPTDGVTPFPSTSVPTDGVSPSGTPSGSPTTAGIPTPSSTPDTPISPLPTIAPTSPVGSVFYKNCGAVRAAGAAPLYRGQPGYSASLDPDGDGVACDKGR
jgi:hypothetical protein